MRISDMRRGLYGLLIVAGAVFGGPDRVMAAAAVPTASGPDEYSLAEMALRDGQVEDGLMALKAAAQRGGVRAGLRLAKIYAEGRIVPRDETKACELYGALADRHSQVDRADPAARLIGEAFRLWAFCFTRSAILPGGEQNLGRAAALFYQAGVMLDDPESLYELARMHLKGEGVAANPRMAVHYLFSATRKRFAPASAMLGALMWEGRVLKQQRVNGLALIKFALESARPDEKLWIDRQHEEALITAKKDEEAEAIRLVEQWKKAYGPETTGATSPLVVQTPPAANPPAQLPTYATQPPAPTRAPGQPQVAPKAVATPVAPGAPKTIEQHNTLPTGVNVPTNASPPAE
jgi:hypothetical protein